MKTTDELIDDLEQLVDAHNLSLSLMRASRTWIGVIRFPDGRKIEYQDLANQNRLLGRLAAEASAMAME